MARVSVWKLLPSGHHAAEADIVGLFAWREPVNRGRSEGLEPKSLLIIEGPTTQRLLLAARTVEAPFPDVAEQIMKAMFVWGLTANGFRRTPGGLLTCYRLSERGIGKQDFPLGLGRQVISKTRGKRSRSFFQFTEFVAELFCVFPCHR